jgi:broad specificity phosphatase PhoE
MKLYLVRHGQSLSNAELEIKDRNHLSDMGRRQAKYLAKRLKKIKFDEFYCSDLDRSKQTSEIVSKSIKLKPKIVPELNEYETLNIKSDEKEWPKEESLRKNKLLKFVDKITKNPEDEKNILIIAHGITNRIILSYLLDLPLKRIVVFTHNNAGMSKLRWSEKFQNWQLAKMNDYQHVPRRFRYVRKTK